MINLNIIFRSCAKINKTSKGGGRPFNLSKEEIILKSLKSLLESSKDFEKRIYLDIVDDSSPETFIKKLKNLIEKYKIKYKIHRTTVKNNGKSMEYSFNLAKNSKQDLIYFCEDDYFHLKLAMDSIFDAYDKKIIGNDNFCLHPTDYPDRYIHLKPSYIFAGKNNHWRSILNTTGTFVMPKRILKKYKRRLFEFAKFNIASTGGEEKTINKIWEEVPCIAPVESFAAHLNEDTLPLYVDWEKEIKKIKI